MQHAGFPGDGKDAQATFRRAGRWKHLPSSKKSSAVTADAFRRLALSLPEAVEGSHMGHADFRVCGKIFATLGPDETWGMVKLTPEAAGRVRSSEAPDVPANQRRLGPPRHH